MMGQSLLAWKKGKVQYDWTKLTVVAVYKGERDRVSAVVIKDLIYCNTYVENVERIGKSKLTRRIYRYTRVEYMLEM